MNQASRLDVRALLDTLNACEARYCRTTQNEAGRLMLEAGTRYSEEIETFLSLYRRDKALSPVLASLQDEIREYVLWLRWLGWNVATLGPPVYGSSRDGVDSLALGLLAYAAGRLIDDGFDNHESYKGRHATLVGALRARLTDAPVYRPCVLSVYVGFSLFQYALRRTRELGRSAVADEISRMFDVLSVGVLAETLLVPPVDRTTYRQVIRRKSAAYNLILYKAFLSLCDPGPRTRLLKILADMDELAQLVNDFVDLEEDTTAGTLNAVTFGVCDHADLEQAILHGANAALLATDSLSQALRDAVATMIRNVINPYCERVAIRAM